MSRRNSIKSAGPTAALTRCLNSEKVGAASVCGRNAFISGRPMPFSSAERTSSKDFEDSTQNLSTLIRVVVIRCPPHFVQKAAPHKRPRPAAVIPDFIKLVVLKKLKFSLMD